MTLFSRQRLLWCEPIRVLFLWNLKVAAGTIDGSVLDLNLRSSLPEFGIKTRDRCLVQCRAVEHGLDRLLSNKITNWENWLFGSVVDLNPDGSLSHVETMPLVGPDRYPASATVRSTGWLMVLIC